MSFDSGTGDRRTGLTLNKNAWVLNSGLDCTAVLRRYLPKR